MILLDTHVLLWVLTDNPRLGQRTRTRIETSAAVHFSAVSIAEIAIKSMVGKIRTPDGLDRLILESGLVELSVTARHATALREFPELARHDLFDRLLVAQAASDGFGFVTADSRLLELGRDFIVDAAQ